MVRYGIWCGICYGLVLSSMARYRMVFYSMVRYGMVQHDLVLSSMEYDMEGCDTAWYGMV